MVAKFARNHFTCGESTSQPPASEQLELSTTMCQAPTR
jgi:hypothetical protein